MLHVAFIVWILYLVYCSYISNRKFGFVTNHYLLTNAYWAVCLYISIYHNYYIHPVSDVIYYIFFIGSFFFNLTLFTTKIQSIPLSFGPSQAYSLERRRVLEIIAILTIIPMAYSNLQKIMAGGDLWIMYEEYWDSIDNKNNYLAEFFKQNIVQPMSYVLMATCMFSYYNINNKKERNLTLFIGALLAVLNMLMTAGGRTGLMRYTFFIILSYIASHYIRDKNLVYRINKNTLIIFLSIGVGAFVFATFGRGGDNLFDVFEIVAERVSLFPALFEAIYKNTNICDGYALGLSMFEQPVSFILYPFKMIGIDVNFERISTIVAQDRWTPATECIHNAAASAYTFYMRDFGVLGVAIGPYLVGKIYNLLWKYCRKDRFLIIFYFCGVCVTCFDSTYPFARGYFFGIFFAFLIKKILTKQPLKLSK